MIKKSYTAKGARIYVARKERLDARRGRAAERTGSRILKGKGVFTPNQRRRRPSATFTYEEWEKEMKSNASRRKKATKKKRSTRKKRPTAAQTRARKRNLKKAQATRRKKVTRRRKKATRKRTVKRRTVKRATSKRRTTKRTAKRRTTKKRTAKRRTKRATSKRRTTKRRTAKRNARRSPPRRRYFRNQVKSFKSDFAKVLKGGLSAVAGLVVQKVATKLLTSTGILDTIPGVQQFKGSVAGLAVALIGTLGAAKFIPGDAKMIGAGMGAGFLHTVLIDGLNAFGQPQLVEYLGNYTESSGKAFGSYYEFEPHQQYPGVGEYYSLPQGMGQYEQAAAGMGQYQQAAAGMGQAGAPRLSQAAAGTGEYLVSGGQGIGEYEEVVPQYSAPEQIQEGISPDLDSAEQALNVSEAAAGIGAYGDEKVPLQSTVYPTGNPEAIPDMPGGSRAGTFAGSNGVFGPSY